MRHSITRLTWLTAVLVTMLAAVLFAACQPISTPPAALPDLPDAAADWQQISETGKIVVGTAVDYPPFEYYDAGFQLDGFDPALMRAIGQQLGVEVEFVDLAFDGLGQALVLGQVDAAISAISETPARARLIDFTNPYFASFDAYLTRAASSLTVTANEDLKDLRVAVQRGSIYEDQVLKTLVEPGLIPPTNLLLYDDIAAAIRDLEKERVDVFVLDLPVAERYVAAGEARLAGQGVNEQDYGIALRKGSTELRAQLDAALAALQADGTTARLAEQYLGIPAAELAPVTATAATAAETAPVLPACLDGMAWVADLSYDDQGMTAPPVMFPGQPFQKSWRVQNIGTCTWDSSYFFAFARGNAPGAAMGGTPVNVRGTVAPGATYDVAVDLVAPLLPGVYQGLWEIHNGAGRAFGQTLGVGVQVAGAPTPTPALTPTPVPGIVFYADANKVTRGEPVTFVWDVETAEAVYFYRDGDDWQVNGVEASGQQTVYPDRTGAYNLRVVKQDGVEEIRTITIEVLEGVGPAIEFFAVVPNDEVPAGACVNIAWRVTGEGAAIQLTQGEKVLWDAAPPEGTLEDCPPAVGEYVYTLTASNAEGADTRQQTVRVVDGAGSRVAEDAAPVIDTFAVSPEAVAVNECVVVSWNVGGDVKTIQILRDDVVILDGAPTTGSGQNCLTEAGSYRFSLVATSSTGASSNAEVTVTAAAPTPVPPPAAAPTDPALTAAPWTLTAIFDGVSALNPPLAGSEITALFGEDGTLSGVAGCNNYTGGYTATDGALSIGLTATTMKFCAEPEGVMDQEALYLALLTTVANYTVEDGVLTLADGSGQTVATFAAGE